MKKTSQDLMNGCGKEIRKEEVVKDAYEIIKCEINSLCPNCQAQKQERLDCYKKELEYWQQHITEGSSRLYFLKQEIKKLEGEK